MSDIDAWAAAGIYDPTSPGAPDQLALLTYLAYQGVGLEEMVERAAAGTLSRAVADGLLAIERSITLEEASARVGLDPVVLTRVWLALGFPPPPLDQPALNEGDLGLLGAFQEVLQLFGIEGALQFTRVLGSSIARISEAAVGGFLVNVEGPMMTGGANETDRARVSAGAAEMAQMLPTLFGQLYRRHFLLAVERTRATQDNKAYGTFHLTLGFCDLVGYTAWSRTLTSVELARAVNDFEEAAHERITTAGGRVVKSIGDAVLFATADPEPAARVALELTRYVVQHPVLTSLRSALVTGDVLGRDGDYYGPVVNLAARIVKEAEPGTVVSDRPTAGFESTPMGTVALRGFGDPVELFVIGAALS